MKYILIIVFTNVTNFATTFESNFQVFDTKTGCDTAKQLISNSLPKNSDIKAVVECINDTKVQDK